MAPTNLQLTGDHQMTEFNPNDPKPPGKLSHVDDIGHAHMVDVTGKPTVSRRATATATVTMSPECACQVTANTIKKGDVLTTAELAGIMAAKRTPELIPLCHPLSLDHIDLECKIIETTVRITATVTSRERTGVEMEALTAASVAALTIFDMCKAVDPAMTIGPIRVESKIKDGVTSFERKD